MIERYSRKEMSHIWTEESKLRRWLEVELAVMEVFEKRGMVRKGISDNIRKNIKINSSRVKEIEERVRHDVIAFLLHIEEQFDDPDLRFMHLGLTSSDVLDTAFATQLRDAGNLLLNNLREVGDVINDIVIEYRDTPSIGRTHGVHAEPITLGVKFASYLAEVCRNYERLKDAISNVSYGKISGAVGVYAHLDPDLEREALEKLGLKSETVSTQVIPRDRHSQFFSTLAIIAGFVERVALEIRHLQRTEVLEISEPFFSGQRGSSAMPHKKNPVLSENLCGLARIVKSNSIAALDNIALWHERDISHSSVERIIGPDSTILLDFMLARLKRVLKGLNVNRSALEKNLNLTKGLIFSEGVLLELVKKGLKRGEAYVIIQRCALRAFEQNLEFKEVLLKDEEIIKYLNKDDIINSFNLNRHLTHTDRIIERTLSLWKEAKEKK